MPINYQTQPGVRHQSMGFSAANGRGLLVTATTANTKSGWVSLSTDTPFAYEQLTVFLTFATINANLVVDIGVSTGAGQWVLAEDLRLQGIIRVNEISEIYTLPVHVPKGSDLFVRLAGSVASANCWVTAIGSSRGIRGAPGYSRCFAITTATNSRGIGVSCTGTPLTESAETVLTTNCKRTADAVFGYLGLDGDTAKTNLMSWAVDFLWGSSTAAVSPQIENIVIQCETISDIMGVRHTGIYPAHIPAGSAITTRFMSTSTATADNKLDIMLYGLEP